MKFKIDTRATYTLIAITEVLLNAALADDLMQQCRTLAAEGSQNFLIDCDACQSAEVGCLDALSALHEECYGQGQSLVFTHYNDDLLETLRQGSADEVLNLAPTMKEAIDIISMEIMERDLMEE